MCTLLQDLKGRSDLPWLVVGDFNEAMWSFEHFSSTPRPVQQMLDFREALETSELADLGFVGVPYTYDNKRGGAANVKVRLDRGTTTSDWRNIFGAAMVSQVTPNHVVLRPLSLVDLR